MFSVPTHIPIYIYIDIVSSFVTLRYFSFIDHFVFPETSNFYAQLSGKRGQMATLFIRNIIEASVIGTMKYVTIV